jgi:hypothetical protein
MTFDWTVNLGHLLTAIGIIGGIASVVYALRSDVKQLKVELAPIKEDLKQLVNVLIQIGRQDEQIKSITQRIDKLEDRG